MQSRRSKRGSIDQSEEEEANKRPKVLVPAVSLPEEVLQYEEQQTNNDKYTDNNEDDLELTEGRDFRITDESSDSTDNLFSRQTDSSEYPTMNTNNQSLSASTSKEDNKEQETQDSTEFNPYEGMTKAEVNRQISMFNAYSREKAKDTTQITNLDMAQDGLHTKLEDDTEKVRVQVEELSPKFSTRRNYSPMPGIIQTPIPPHLVQPIYRDPSSRSPHPIPNVVPYNTTLASSPIHSYPRKSYGELGRTKDNRTSPAYHSSPESRQMKGFHNFMRSRGHGHLPQPGNHQPEALTSVSNVQTQQATQQALNATRPGESVTMADFIHKLSQPNTHINTLLTDARNRLASDFTTSTTARNPPSHAPTAPKIVDSTMMFSNADQMYHCRVPLAYTTCNPNTQPLSTTDPFFKNFPSHPDRISAMPHLSNVPYPTAVKDKTGKRSGWANLDKNWHEEYADRHRPSSEYPEEYGEDSDTEDDDH